MLTSYIPRGSLVRRKGRCFSESNNERKSRFIMNCGGDETKDRFPEVGAGQDQFEEKRCDVPATEGRECACGVAF